MKLISTKDSDIAIFNELFKKKKKLVKRGLNAG